jgi:FMN-dependent NADH-azoreductase
MERQMTKTLVVNASARRDASTSRQLTAKLAAALGGDLIQRDLAESLPQVDEAWIGANFTPSEDRSDDQTAQLTLSEDLIGEIEAADTIVIGLPIYNFGMPAALKAWVDLVARARRTFRYTEYGPEGLLTGKKAYIVVSSGGTEAFSDIDFATPHLQHVLGFIGIKDVTVIRADQQMVKGEAAVQAALEEINQIASARNAA